MSWRPANAQTWYGPWYGALSSTPLRLADPRPVRLVVARQSVTLEVDHSTRLVVVNQSVRLTSG